MEAESNAGFHCDGTLFSAFNRHTTSFQSGAINSTSEMIPLGNYFGVNNSSGMILSGTSNPISNPGISQGGSSSGSILLDSSGLKHDTGLAVEWSPEEQFKLDEGLVKFAAEPTINKYIKIAASLRDKTVRDVALRCRWMTRKRRKQEEHNSGKKVTYRKDKLVESSSKTNVTSDPPLNMVAYSRMDNMDQNKCMPYEALSGKIKHLLEQNVHLFNQITANLSTFKLQDNVDLFCCTRNNITAILNEMRDMPGIMSHMPPLDVSIKEDLADSIFLSTSKTLIFGSQSGFHMKEEPRC